MPSERDIGAVADLLYDRGGTFLIGAGFSHELGYPLASGLARMLAEDLGVDTGPDDLAVVLYASARATSAEERMLL